MSKNTKETKNDAQQNRLLKRLGWDDFPQLKAIEFIEVLFWAAMRDEFEILNRFTASLTFCHPDEEIKLPPRFCRINQGKLNFWCAFYGENTENLIGDTNFSGAVYHSEMKCGFAINFNDAGGVNCSKPFRFNSSVLPQKRIVKILLKFLREESPPFCGTLLNEIPDLCSRECLHRIFKKIDAEYEFLEPGEFDEYFYSGYREPKQSRKKGRKKLATPSHG